MVVVVCVRKLLQKVMVFFRDGAELRSMDASEIVEQAFAVTSERAS